MALVNRVKSFRTLTAHSHLQISLLIPEVVLTIKKCIITSDLIQFKLIQAMICPKSFEKTHLHEIWITSDPNQI